MSISCHYAENRQDTTTNWSRPTLRDRCVFRRIASRRAIAVLASAWLVPGIVAVLNGSAYAQEAELAAMEAALDWSSQQYGADAETESQAPFDQQEEFAPGLNAVANFGDFLGSVWNADLSVTGNIEYFLDQMLQAAAASGPAVQSASISSNAGADRNYVTGDLIEISVTFDQAVTVKGAPRMALLIGNNTRYADYSEGSNTTTLTFSYEVAATDRDQDGISIAAGGLMINGGAIHKQGDADTAAATANPEVADDKSHRVNVIPFRASFQSIPTRHDGSGDFNVDILFTSDLGALRDLEQAVQLTGGTLDSAVRLDGRDDLWRLTISPSGNADVTVPLSVTTACSAESDICDSGDEPLAAGLAASVRGPDTPVATDATLAALALSGISISPEFNSATTAYTATVTRAAGATTVTASPESGYASVVITPRDSHATAEGHQVDLRVGDTVITLEVTAENGVATKTYTVTVTREDWMDDSFLQGGVLVKNLDQSTTSTRNLEVGFNEFAQGFTTGDHAGGYSLSGVRVRAYRGGSNNVRVSLWTGNSSRPLTHVMDFVNPGNLNSSGTKTFTVPTQTKLDSRTFYYVVLSFRGTSGNLYLSAIDSDAEDSDSLSGWSISNGHKFRPKTSTGSWPGNGNTMLIGIQGAPLPVDIPYVSGMALTSMAPGGDSVYKTGDVIKATLTYSDAVNVDTSGGTPDLTLMVGADTREAAYDPSESSATELVFRYTVTAADHDQDGVSITGGTLALNGAAIHKQGDANTAALLDYSGLTDDLEHRVNPSPSIVAGGVAVIGKPRAAADTYGAGEKIRVAVTFDEPVEVVGNPHFEFSMGSVDVAALLELGSGTATLVFAYPVLAGDTDSNGIWIGDHTRTLKLDAGERIRSLGALRDAVLEHARLGRLIGHKVNGRNSAPSGLPVIDGTPEEDLPLTVSTSGIGDTDGLITPGYTYQWIRVNAGVETEIDGAIATTYTPQEADVGLQLKVRVTFRDDDGNTHTLVSNPVTILGANVAPVFTSADQFEAAENQTAAGTVAATDADSQDTVRYAITGGADRDRFEIGATSGALRFSTAPDYEQPADVASTDPVNDPGNNQYLVEVTATSGAGERAETITQTITITVTDAANRVTATLRDLQTSDRFGLSDTQASVRPFRVYLAFSEPVAGIRPEELVTVNANATLVEFNCEGRGAHVLCVTMEIDGDHGEQLSLSVPADVADGGNQAADNIYTAEILRNPLTVDLTSSASAPVHEPFDLRLEFNQEVLLRGLGGDVQIYDTGDYLHTDDLVLTNATLATLNERGHLLDYSVESGRSRGRVRILPRALFKGALSVQMLANTVRTRQGDGNAPASYQIEVDTYTGSTLSGLTLSGATLAPAFDAATRNYNAKVADGVNTTTVTATAAVSGASVQILPADANDGVSGHQVAIDANNGATITVTVTDPRNSDWQQTYSVQVSAGATPTGLPVIDGAPQLNQPLTVNTSGIGDTDGLTTPGYTYQWIRVNAGVDTDIERATATTYTPQEADVGLQLRVRVTFRDDDGNTHALVSNPTANVTRNAAPVFTSADQLESAENQTAAGTVAATDADSQDTVRYAVTGGADRDRFDIGATSGALRFSTAPDYEQPADVASTDPVNDPGNNQYLVEVTATGGAGERATTATQIITVTVTNVTEQTTLEIAAVADPSVEEDTAFERTLTLNGAPVGEVRWTIAGPDRGQFTLGATTGILTMAAQNYENPQDNDGDNDYQVTVTAIDGDGNQATQTITITVTDAANRVTATLRDLQTSDRFGLSDTQASVRPFRVYLAFSEPVAGIRPEELVTVNANATLVEFNCEGRGAHVLCVTMEIDGDHGEQLSLSVPADVADGGNQAADNIYTAEILRNPLTVDLTSSASAPVHEPFDLRLEFNQEVLLRGLGGDVQIYDTGDYLHTDDLVLTNATLATLNERGHLLDYSVESGRSRGRVRILPRALFKGALSVQMLANTVRTRQGDGNAPASYQIEVDTYTGSTLSGLTLSGATLAPAFDAATRNYNAKVADGVNTTTVTATAAVSGASVQILPADANDGVSGHQVAIDANNGATITVTVTDPRNSDWQQTYSVQVSAGATPTGLPVIDGAPQLNQPLTVNTSGIGDTDGLTTPGYTYQWIRVNAGVDTDIERATATTYTPQEADVGLQLRVRVTFRDDDGNTHALVSNPTANVTRNAAPVFTSADQLESAENQTAAGTVAATDADSQDTVRYAVTGGADRDRFDIGATSGALRFSTAPDYEQPADVASTDPVNDPGNNQYLVEVTATGGAGERATTATQIITVTVTNVTEQTTLEIAAVADPSVEEDTAFERTLTLNGAPVGEVRWTIAGPDRGQFTLGATTGILTMAAQNYENPQDNDGDNDYQVTVTAIDGDGNQATQTITITVTDAANRVTATLRDLQTSDRFGLSDTQASVRPFRVYLAFSEPVAGIRPEELVTVNANATLVEFNCEGRGAHVLCVTMEIDGDHGEQLSLSVPADVADGGNQAADNIYTAEILRNPLTVDLTSSASAPVHEPFDLRLEFNQEVLLRGLGGDVQIYDTGDYLHTDDLVLTNATLATLNERGHLLDYSVESGRSRGRVRILPRALFKGALSVQMLANTVRTRQGDGNAPASYQIEVDTYTGSTLSGLTLSGATLAPAFDAATRNYNAKVADGVNTTTVTATAAVSGASVQILPADANDGVSGHQVAIDANNGATITVTVTDPRNSDWQQTYSVQVSAGATPTGLPVIDGAPQLNQPLTVNTSGIGDTDGLITPGYTYQWIRVNAGVDTDIERATATTYTPQEADVGLQLKVRVTFRDDDGNTHTLVSNPTANVTRNAAPVVANALDNQTATAGRPFTYVIPEDAFSDSDSDPLRYSATQDDGSALPAWLTFSPASRTFEGTPGSGDAGNLTLKVTAKDRADSTALSVADTFTLAVGANAAPSAADNAVTVDEDDSHTFQAGEFNFADRDTGDTLASVRIVTLPGAGKGALTLDGANVTANQVVTKANIDAGKLTYTPPADANGNPYATFTFKVSDGVAESNSAYTLTVNVTAVNDAPVVANALDNQTATAGRPFTYVIPEDAFSDSDSDPLRYSATQDDGSALPAWLTFSPASRTFEGTPGSGDAGNLTLKVTAKDRADSTALSVADTFTLAVGANAAPSAADNAVTVDEDDSHTFQAGEFNFADRDTGDTLASVRIVTLPGAGKGALTLDGANVTANQVVTKANIDAGKLTYTPPADANGNPYATFTFKVSDGVAESNSAYTLTVNVTAVNDAPVVANALDNQTATAGRPFTYVIPEDAFSDSDSDPLRYSATQDDGSALPAWLTFSPASRTFEGTPGSGDAGNLTLKVTAKDRADSTALSVADTFTLAVGANAAPSAADNAVTVDEDDSHTFQAGEFNFADRDTGDTLASVRIVTLPGAGKGALTLDGANVTANQVVTKANIDAGKLTYTPPADANGNPYATFTFKVSDGVAESNSAYTLTVNVTAVNDAPVVANALDNQTATAGRPFTYVIPEDAFSDSDSDPLRYSATQDDGSALPAWLTFSPASRTFEGTPGSGDAGNLTLKVTAKDRADSTALSVADTFTLAVGANAAPSAADNAVTVDEDDSHTFQAGEFNFADRDTGDTLASVRIVTLPGAGKGALTLDGANVTANQVVTKANIDAGKLTYTPPADANGNPYATFTFKVSDGVAESNSAYTLTVNVTAVNDAPVVANALDNQTATAGRPFTYVIPEDAFSDSDSDPLRYSATQDDGSALPAWLTFSPASRTFEGTPGSGDAGNLTLKVTAKDRADSTALSVADTFTLAVGANAAPSAADNAVTVDEDDSHTFQAGEFNFADRDTGDTLASVRIVTLPGAGKGALTLDGANVTANQVVTKANIDAGKLTYTPPADANGNPYATFTFKVSDGVAESNSAYTLTVNVTAVNDAPVVANALDNQTATAGRPFTYVIPEDAFSDSDSDPLRYSATQDDGSALPAWLTFSPASRTFEGTPGSGDAGNLTLKVTAKDRNGASALSVADTFELNVVDNVQANTAPTGADGTVSTAEDSAYTFQAGDFRFADTDPGDTLSSVRVVTLPASGALALNGAAVTANDVVPAAQLGGLVFTPAANTNGNAYATFTFKVSDGVTESNSATTLTVNVTAVNDAPVVANALADQSARVSDRFRYVVPADAFADIDGDTLRYSATQGDGGALPSWLTFSPSTRTFEGTPGSSDAGALTVKVTAKDRNGASALSVADTFELNVTDQETAGAGICSRTPQVRDRILTLLINVHGHSGDCATVTSADLAKITDMDLASNNITALKSDDFAGLTSLLDIHLGNNRLEELPPGVFDGLTKVEIIWLHENGLKRLPPNVFADLTSLRQLDLAQNRLQAIPLDELERLPALRRLSIYENPGTSEFTLQLMPSTLSVLPGGQSAYRVRLTQWSNNGVRVEVASNQPSLTVEPRVLTFNRDDWFRSQEVTVSADASASGTATLSHAYAGSDYPNTAPPPGVTVQVTEPRRQLSVSDPRVTEGPGASLEFVVTLTPAASSTVTVDYVTADGSAAADSDYTAADGTLTFAPRETTKTITVAVLDDAHDEGEETLTLTLSNPVGASVLDPVATGTIENTDPMPQAWLTRFGRVAAAQAVEAVTGRLAEADSESNWNLGSLQQLWPTANQDTALALQPTLTAAHVGAPWRAMHTTTGPSTGLNSLSPMNSSADTGLMNHGSAQANSNGQGLFDLRSLLSSTSFLWKPAGATGDSGIADWTAWGRGASTRFQGQDADVSVGGTVLTGTTGWDYERGRWLVGVALSHADGEGAYQSLDQTISGDIESTLTSLHPYLRAAINSRLEAWGMLGYGRGGLKLNAAESMFDAETGIESRMAALGLEGDLWVAKRFRLSAKSDAMWSHTASSATVGLVSSHGAASRLRVLVEGSAAFDFSGGRRLTPVVEIGLRQDGGDAETGLGVEIGLGLAYADPASGLAIEARARGLLAHEDKRYREWGASGSIRYAPNPAGRGLQVAVTASLGAVASKVRGMWSIEHVAGLASEAHDPHETRMSMKFGYGIYAPRWRTMFLPFVEMDASGGAGRRQSWGLALQRDSEGASAELVFSRAERPNAESDRGGELRFRLPFGSRQAR